MTAPTMNPIGSVQLIDADGQQIDTLPVSQPAVSATTLLNAVTTTGAGSAVQPSGKDWTFQASGTVASGTGSATIEVQVSNDGTNYITLGTISLTLGTAATSDGFASAARWKYVRGNVTAISGTTATVTLTMGS